ncbi:hypothetical protein LOK49_LG14G01749 [Camellia lanceoleosa]|uniref:Uncharacterized protein n=1 Tax=Camellia lanceoleosa TaxID=1840588 RepID=A0ACC0FCH2_9ERIC|nr:hypothetical protein LOK49_LG14G01749 [Camellia lanceoleosa]
MKWVTLFKDFKEKVGLSQPPSSSSSSSSSFNQDNNVTSTTQDSSAASSSSSPILEKCLCMIKKAKAHLKNLLDLESEFKSFTDPLVHWFIAAATHTEMKHLFSLQLFLHSCC